MRQREGELGETPTMADVLKQAIESRLVDLHTCMPATVVSYDPAKQKASVQPNFKRRFRNGDVFELPVIENVTVRMPRAGASFIHLPLNEGDQVMLHFAERSLDTWKEAGGNVDPGTESRKHALSDAYAEVGGYPFNDVVEGSGTDLLIVNDKARISMQPGGKMKIENDKEELITVVSDLVDALLQVKTNTAAGPQPLVPPSLLTEIKQRLGKLKG